MLKKILKPIFITNADVDKDILENVSKRLGKTVTKLKWEGVSGQGVTGRAFIKSGTNGSDDLGDWVTFIARTTPPYGGYIMIADKIIPYIDATYQDPEILIKMLKRKFC